MELDFFYALFCILKLAFFICLNMIALTFLQVNVATISTNQLQQSAIY